MFGDRRRPAATIAAEIDRIIGINIRRAREDVKLGQHEVAGLLGISSPLLARYEEGHERTPAALLLELGRHLGCQLADLFAGMPSLEVEEDFQGTRQSFGQPKEVPPASPLDMPVSVETGMPGATGCTDVAAVSRIIQAFSTLRSPVVRERLLQLLQALQ